MLAKAREPMPQKQSVRNSRRLRANRTCSAISVHVEESVEVEDCQGEFLHLGGIVGVGVEETGGQFLFGGRRRATGSQPPGVVDALDGRGALPEQAGGESGGE